MARSLSGSPFDDSHPQATASSDDDERYLRFIDIMKKALTVCPFTSGEEDSSNDAQMAQLQISSCKRTRLLCDNYLLP